MAPKQKKGQHQNTAGQNSPVKMLTETDEDYDMKKLYTTIQSIETNIKSLDTKFDSLQVDVTAVKNSIKLALDQSKEALDKVEKLTNTVNEQNKIIESLKTHVAKVDTKYDTLNEKLMQLEIYNRKENLLFHGIAYANKENCAEKVRNFLKDTLKMNPTIVDNMNFQRCHRLPGKTVPTPIICRFASFPDRESVWSLKGKLKELGVDQRISEHFPPEVVQCRNTLAPVMMAAIKDGRKATLKNEKLLIDGVTYTINTVHKLPPNLNPATIATKTQGEITCFFSEASPLSNFHQAKFELEGKTYNCVEEVLQLGKAEFANQPEVIQAMKQASHPREFKRLGDSCKVDQKKWLPIAKDLMSRACKEKFLQNESCREFLIQTKHTILAEAGPDKTWGICCKMTDENAFDQKKWSGQNNLGKILMAIRDGITKDSRINIPL